MRQRSARETARLVESRGRGDEEPLWHVSTSASTSHDWNAACPNTERENPMVTIDALGLFIAMLGIATTVFLWRWRFSVDAKKGTLDFIATHEVNNREWMRVTVAAHAVLADPAEWPKILTPMDTRARELALDILMYLNHYELVAIAIGRGLIDEDLYASWYRSSYANTWRSASGFVMQLRRQHRGAANRFAEFECLARRWVDEKYEKS